MPVCSINDEAHHIHDTRMAWFKSIEDIHNRLKQKGAALSMQVDTTVTPKHNNGAIFVQTVTDYPLLEAISQNIVKHPVLPDAASRAKLSERQSAKYTEKYADYTANCHNLHFWTPTPTLPRWEREHKESADYARLQYK